MDNQKYTLWAKSLVNQNKEAVVQLELDGKTIAQMSTDQARAFALSVLVSAEAADQDAFMVSWAVEKVGVDENKAAAILVEYRNWRENRHVIDGQSRKV